MRLRPQKSVLWLATLTLLVLAANLAVFFNRAWEDSFYPSDYATLNYPLDTPTLRAWKVESRDVLRLDLAWNVTPAAWQLLVDGQPGRTMPGTTPRLHLTGAVFDGAGALPDYKHVYTLRPLPAGTGPDLTIGVTAIAKEFYRRNGLQFNKDVYLIETTLPIGSFKRLPLSHWVDDYRYVGAAGLAAADRVVREQIGIRDSDDTLTRMDKVVRFIRTQFATAGGVPKDDFRWMNPWRIYGEMTGGTGKGWCTQNAQVYTFFANRAGIPTRFVFGATTQDDAIVYNGHSWAESWVKEQQRWAYVDVQRPLIAVRDRGGRVLNSADILHLCEHNAFDGITARIYKNWGYRDVPFPAADPLTPITVPFSAVNAVARGEFNHQAIIKYRHAPAVEDIRSGYWMFFKDGTFGWTNLKRYLWDPPLAYSMLPTEGRHTYRVRQALFAALLLSLLALIVAALRPRRT